MYYAFEHSGSNRNLEVLVFEEYPGESSRSRERTYNKLSPHMVRAKNRTQATSVGGECSHHCASPAPHELPHVLFTIKMAASVKEGRLLYQVSWLILDVRTSQTHGLCTTNKTKKAKRPSNSNQSNWLSELGCFGKRTLKSDKIFSISCKIFLTRRILKEHQRLIFPKSLHLENVFPTAAPFIIKVEIYSVI